MQVIPAVLLAGLRNVLATPCHPGRARSGTPAPWGGAGVSVYVCVCVCMFKVQRNYRWVQGQLSPCSNPHADPLPAPCVPSGLI